MLRSFAACGVLALAVLVSACGSDGETTTTPGVSPTPTPTVAPTESPTPTPTPPTPTAEPKLHISGIITVNGQPVAAGTPLEIRAGDQTCASAEVASLGGQSTYALDIAPGCGGSAEWEILVQGVSIGALEKTAGQQDLALTLGTPSPTETSTTEPPPTATATEDAAVFTADTFATGVDENDDPVDPLENVVAVQTTHLYYFYDYTGMTDGRDFHFVWYHDGEVVNDSGVSPWELGEEGNAWVSTFYEDGRALATGTWSVELLVDGRVLLSDEIVLLEGTVEPTETATEPAVVEPDDFYASIVVQVLASDFDPSGDPVAVMTVPGQYLIAQHAFCKDTADGKCQSVFFFLNDEYVGRDATSPWYGISEPMATPGDTIILEYANYLPDDPLCCPTGDPIRIEFYWDGTSLRRSQTPPSELQ